jgi:hypothetical protein
MKAKIQPVTLLGQATADTLFIVGANAQLGLSATFSYQLLGANAEPVHVGQVTMPPPDYEQWGSDDTFAVNYVARKLGLTVLELVPLYTGHPAPSASVTPQP